MLQKIVLAAFLTILPFSNALACQCPAYTEADGLKFSAALIPEVRVVKIQPESPTGRVLLTLKVLRSGKGVKEGEQIEVDFSQSCYFVLPKIGGTMKNVVLSDRNGIPYINDSCLPFPSTESGQAFLAEYQSTWFTLDKEARTAPGNLRAQLALGNYLADWNDNRNALAAFQRAEKLAPRNNNIKLKIAAMEMRLLNLDNAKLALDGAIATMPDALTKLLQLQLAGQEERQKDANTGNRRYGFYISAPAPKLTGLNLSGIELSGIMLTGVEAEQSNWNMANVFNSAMPKANLSGANLTYAYFRNTELSGSVLMNARAEKAKFTHSQLQDIRGRGLKAANSDFSRSRLTGSDFSTADLSGTNFYAADLSGVDFRDAELREARFRFAQVDCSTQFPEGFTVSGRELIPTDSCDGRYSLNFDKFDFSDVDFSWRIQPFNARDIRRATFRNARFTHNFTFENAKLTGADFSGSSHSFTRFTGADVRNALFIHVDGLAWFSRADLSGSTITGVPNLKPDAQNAPRLEIRGIPKVTGATLQYVQIDLSTSYYGDDGSSDPTSFLDATIKNSVIDCSDFDMPRQGVTVNETKLNRSILIFDVARKIVFRNPSNKLSDYCAKYIETYLGGDCREGQAKAGFAYTCPAPPQPR